jgi:hypothetical protein
VSTNDHLRTTSLVQLSRLTLSITPKNIQKFISSGIVDVLMETMENSESQTREEFKNGIECIFMNV